MMKVVDGEGVPVHGYMIEGLGFVVLSEYHDPAKWFRGKQYTEVAIEGIAYLWCQECGYSWGVELGEREPCPECCSDETTYHSEFREKRTV